MLAALLGRNIRRSRLESGRVDQFFPPVGAGLVGSETGDSTLGSRALLVDGVAPVLHDGRGSTGPRSAAGVFGAGWDAPDVTATGTPDRRMTRSLALSR